MAPTVGTRENRSSLGSECAKATDSGSVQLIVPAMLRTMDTILSIGSLPMKITVEEQLVTFRCVAVAAALLSLPTEAIAASGRLVDRNGQPVADAWVVARREQCRGVMDCNSICVEVKVAKTDERGKYSIDLGLRSLGAYGVTAYREGYLPAYRHVGIRGLERIMERGAQDVRFAKMDPVSGRIAHLAKTAGEMNCSVAPHEQRLALLPVYGAMFREATSIARFPEHHKVAREICREMYWAARRLSDPSYPPEAERAQQERYLQTIEPACNTPLDDSKEREVLSAIEKGNLTRIRAAAREGFDFNRRLDGRNPPIVIAATKGSAEMVNELAAGGAKADEFGEDGRTALDHIFSGLYGPQARRVAVVRALL